MSRKAANLVFAQITLKPASVLGLATGSTPVGVYEQLTAWYARGDLDFSQVKTVNLDEYRGISGEHQQSYRYFMQKHLFSKVNINQEHVYIPNGLETEWEKECRQYDRIIEELGGIDLQILGLGHNGHIGFNEPADSFFSSARCVDLAQSTIQANRRFFQREEEMPAQAYTVGMKAIMSARKILLLVSGKEKAEILNQALYGPVTPWIPASILQLHPDVTVIADKAALGF